MWQTLLKPVSLSIIIDALRLYILAPFHLRNKQITHMTFGEYLHEFSYSREFAEAVILPAISAMCTCSYEQAKNYPALMLLMYFTQRALNGMRRVIGGSKEVITKLSGKFRHVHCNTSIVSIFPGQNEKVVVQDNKGNEYIFDHVIIATQANHAKQMLIKAPEKLIGILNSFEYVKGSAFVHTDDNIMPKLREDWGNVHFGYIPTSSHPIASIWLNPILPSLATNTTNVFQTIFPSESPLCPSKIMGVMHFERPLMNAKSVEAVQSLVEYQGKDNIWYCGAHVVYGIPLLENAVKSGVYVAERLGCKIPWEHTEIHFCPHAAPFSFQPGLYIIGALLIILGSVMFI